MSRKVKTRPPETISPSEIDDLIGRYIAQEAGVPPDNRFIYPSLWEYIWKVIDTSIENVEEWMTRPE